jgi:signal transduction histidine kinase
VLRADDAGERAPQPGLGDLDELLERSRAAGAEVEWEVETPEVPPALGLTAYRIVQQGLANAAEHAPGAAVRVRVVPDGGVLRVAVVNGVPAQRRVRSDADGAGRGAGIPGMRERAAVHGGEVAAAPTPDGGFALTATLPLPGAAPGDQE